MNTVTFRNPLGTDAHESFPAASTLPARDMRRTALESVVAQQATIAGEVTQIRAIECLRVGAAVSADGIRRNLTKLDLLRMEAAPMQPVPLSVDGQAVGVVLGLLLMADRLFAVVAIGESLALEIAGQRYQTAEGILNIKVEPEGMAYALAGVVLHGESMPSATTRLPLAMASPPYRARQHVGEYDPETNARLSVGLDIAAAGCDFLTAADKVRESFFNWRQS